MTQSGDILLVYGNFNGTCNNGQNLNIVSQPHGSSGLLMAGVKKSFL